MNLKLHYVLMVTVSTLPFINNAASDTEIIEALLKKGESGAATAKQLNQLGDKKYRTKKKTKKRKVDKNQKKNVLKKKP